MIQPDRSNHALEGDPALHNLKHLTYSCRTLVEHVHHMSVSGYAYLRGDQMNMQRLGCLCPLSLALSTALVIVWVVISEHDGERLRTRCKLPSQP